MNSEKVPDTLKLPESFTQLLSEMKNNKYSSKEFVLILKGMVCICAVKLFHGFIHLWLARNTHFILDFYFNLKIFFLPNRLVFLNNMRLDIISI